MTTVGHTTDRSRTSVSQDVGRKLGASDWATEAHVEIRDFEQEARVATLLTAPAPDLYAACTEQVERLARWDAAPESLTEQEGNAEMDRWGALCKRVATEPADNLRDLAGKARLSLADLDRFYPLEQYRTPDWLMMRAILRDAIAFGDADVPTLVVPEPLPALVALIAEWQAVEAYVNGQNGLSDAEAEPHHDRSLKLQMEIYRFPAASVADLLAKVPVFEDELQDALSGLDGARTPENTLAGAAWLGLFRDFGRLTERSSKAVVPDPIFAVIEKDRALAAEHIRLLSISGSKPDDDPSWEPTHDASDAQWEHWREVLLKTVPTTAAGCAALARYANEWVEREGIGLDEDGQKIFDLIGRSPLVTAVPADAEVEAQAVANAIEALWPEWAALNRRDYHDDSPEAEQRGNAMFERRMALIHAADALPATSRTARYAKALALAWLDQVDLWTYRKPLADYTTDGRLVLSIEASLTGKPAWTGASA